jgi:hypothetical protein
MNVLRRLLGVRIDLWEILLCGALAGFAFWISQVAANPVQSEKEMQSFRAKYGPHHATEREEERMIRGFFGDRRNGFFVDVGANH